LGRSTLRPMILPCESTGPTGHNAGTKTLSAWATTPQTSVGAASSD